MRRAEALSLVGARVSAWTSANGTYVGTLVRVTEDRPWRAVVAIDGVLEPAVCFEFGRPFRRGFRPGQEIEVGGGSVEPTELAGATDYLALLDAQADDFAARHARYLAGGFGDPAQPSVARTHAWLDAGSRQVRQAAAILRREALPVEERVEVTLEGGSAVVDLGAPCTEVEDAVWRLPPSMGVRRVAPRVWRVPEASLPAFRAAMETLEAPEAAVVAERLQGLGPSPSP